MIQRSANLYVNVVSNIYHILLFTRTLNKSITAIVPMVLLILVLMAKDARDGQRIMIKGQWILSVTETILRYQKMTMPRLMSYFIF